jgi:hypothetical protein
LEPPLVFSEFEARGDVLQLTIPGALKGQVIDDWCVPMTMASPTANRLVQIACTMPEQRDTHSTSAITWAWSDTAVNPFHGPLPAGSW